MPMMIHSYKFKVLRSDRGHDVETHNRRVAMPPCIIYLNLDRATCTCPLIVVCQLQVRHHRVRYGHRSSRDPPGINTLPTWHILKFFHRVAYLVSVFTRRIRSGPFPCSPFFTVTTQQISAPGASWCHTLRSTSVGYIGGLRFLWMSFRLTRSFFYRYHHRVCRNSLRDL